MGDDEKIGHIFCFRTFLLYGTTFSRSVAPVLMPSHKDLSEWVGYLRGEGVEVIALGPITEGWRRYGYIQQRTQWLGDPDGLFVCVYGESDAYMKQPLLFRFK